MSIKRAVQGQQRVVTAIKPQVRGDGKGEGRASAATITAIRLADQVQRSGFVRYWDQPVGHRNAAAVRWADGEILPGDANGGAERLALNHPGVQVGDESACGPDVDLVAHRQHAGDADIHHFMGQRTVGADFCVRIGYRRSGCRIGLRGAAGVEHEQPDSGVGEQVPQDGPVNELRVAGQPGILEQQVTMSSGTHGRY